MDRNDMKVIDVDVHNSLKSAHDLVPYLPEPWKSRVASSGLGLPGHGYHNPIGVNRQDCRPPSGGPAASDPNFLTEDLLVPFHIECAILTGDLMGVSTIHDPDYGAALASAYNDYVAEHWLANRPQFRGSILVSAHDPLLAAREIDRMAEHPGMVGVIMGSGQRALLGQRQFHPIYEAAARHGLPVAIHPGTEGAGGTMAPTPSGYPTRYLEWHTSLSQNYMAHLISLICDGVFEKFPTLKFVMLEGGIAWLPHLMWRLDKNYKGLRSTVPWLKRMPSEYIRDHCLFSTQPIEEPDDPKQLLAIFDMIDAENILLFSSDYPHWDNDMPTEILKKLRPEARQKIYYDNAKQLYNL
ncbi:amidohydrolase family protein [Paenibacillus ginsengarvi]|uniref:Amidohydrolase n=1 Tax=Paenibacillus ginsengarvi TaxID=400777 RepID=A0A3B0C0I8_9BACL|nr:amidohydrolase family protein [Paenibacillus ginsengarvi]RKN77126.1 amidohydrolase [Paenibacillus ginsengarvi]